MTDSKDLNTPIIITFQEFCPTIVTFLESQVRALEKG